MTCGEGIPAAAPWREVIIEDADDGNIGIEMRPGSSAIWVVFYGRRGGRNFARHLDRRRAEALSLRLRQAIAAMGDES